MVSFYSDHDTASVIGHNRPQSFLSTCPMKNPLDEFPRLSALRLIAFSIAGLAIGGVQTAVVIYLPSFYAQRFGLGLGLVGTIFMVCRLLNAFSDPLIGVLSDRTNTRFGQRKPWVIGGGLLLMLAVVATYLPPSSANGLYLGIALFSLYLGNSAFSTPLYAWAGSLSPYYHERTRNQTYLQTVISLGLVSMVLIPLIFQWFGINDPDSMIAAMGSSGCPFWHSDFANDRFRPCAVISSSARRSAFWQPIASCCGSSGPISSYRWDRAFAAPSSSSSSPAICNYRERRFW